MKSAFELAMERLRNEEPDQALTEEQKAAIAEIDRRFEAKLAERRLFLQPKIATAQYSGQREEAAALERQLASDQKVLEEDREREKSKVRDAR